MQYALSSSGKMLYKYRPQLEPQEFFQMSLHTLRFLVCSWSV